ncbi:hypothetical protein M5X11_13010 [Paenibacillus alginolyticus]|uniref:hypothetical protein n=1 Tax=Paenibacillus alginolyticus TaxID=59839 RepID=UPI0004111A01|nr:hypothetical protein [Paenibacillus alginolyticus]MCY9665875.1 hypothetical protein [Paenibacillus alginolyticus]
MLRGIDQMETGILLTKMSVVLAKLNFGRPEEKRVAREECERLSKVLAQHVDPHAFKLAALNLGFTEEEMRVLEPAAV